MVQTAELTEYLTTVYRPDREYIDGVIEERNLGEYDHANLQTAIAAWFRARMHEWEIRVVVEQRIQVSETRYRVPNVAVFRREQKIEQIFTTPPLIIVEVLSPEDRLHKVFDRCEDYRRFGAENIWIVSPQGPKLWIATAAALIEGGARVSAGGHSAAYLALSELELD
ncbi:MAG: Uma2 family endonuclease [Bryobacteraceae bacterium]